MIKLNPEFTKAFPVGVTQSSIVAAKINQTPVFLVGDSASTPHFFFGTGLNWGWLMAEKLSSLLSSNKKFKTIAKEYDEYIGQLSTYNLDNLQYAWFSPDRIKEICHDFDLTKNELLKLATKFYTTLPKNLRKEEICTLLYYIFNDVQSMRRNKKRVFCSSYTKEYRWDQPHENFILKVFPFLKPIDKIACDFRLDGTTQIPLPIPFKKYESLVSKKDLNEFLKWYDQFGSLLETENQNQNWARFLGRIHLILANWLKLETIKSKSIEAYFNPIHLFVGIQREDIDKEKLQQLVKIALPKIKRSVPQYKKFLKTYNKKN